MPLLSVFDIAPMVDGRQSPSAIKVRRGAARLLRDLGFAVVPELTLADGRRADLIGIGVDGEVVIIEIKSSLADLRADDKWPSYKRACDRFFFASLPEVGDIFPPAEGLIMTDGYDAAMVREAVPHRLTAPVRRALHLRVAQTAARRLHELEDPQPQVSIAV